MAAVDANLNLPRNLYLEVTNRCNLKCKACILYKGSWESPRDITLEELIRITDQFPELEEIALHGIGEPLLNKDLPAMIRHLKNRNVFVRFNSNGILLDERQQSDLIAAGLDELRISLDAASPQGYKAMRNSNKFDQIVDNLKSFVELTGRLRANHPKLSFWYLGTRENIAELPDFIRLAASISVSEVYLQRLVYFQDDNGYGLATPAKTLMESDDKTRKLVNQSQSLAKQFGIQFNASGLTTPLESVRVDSGDPCSWKKCFRPKTLMYITANGNVLPTGLQEIWLGSKYQKFRQTHQTDTPPKCCRGCGILWSL